MIVVVFEFEPDPERGARYFELAEQLREEVEKIDGFLSVERFRSLRDGRRYVSVSFWRDMEAAMRWREHLQHRRAQLEALARGLFRDFRITVAEVRRQTTLTDALRRGQRQAGGSWPEE